MATGLQLSSQLGRRHPGEPDVSATTAAAAAPDRDVATRTGDQPVLSIRASVPSRLATAAIAEALRDVRSYMEEHHATPAGPPFSICREHEDTVDIEAGWPTERPLGGSGRIHSGLLPHSLARAESSPVIAGDHEYNEWS